MFNKLKKLIFNNRKESINFDYDEEYELEEIENPTGEIIYINSSKILMVTEKDCINNTDNIEWFRGTIKLEKVKKYLKNIDINKGDLVEVNYKESVRNDEVINREIQSLIKLEDVSYDIKTQISKVKKVYNLEGFTKGIEFEDGSTHSEFRLLDIHIPPIDEGEFDMYRKVFMYEGDICKHTYLEIFKDSYNTRNIITIKVEKISDKFTDDNRLKWLISSYEDVKHILD